MELKTWTPSFDFDRDFRSMMERLPRLFGEMTMPFRPTIDMHQEGETLVVTAELPGMDVERDIEVTLDDDTLVITGEKTTERKIDEKDHFLSERHYGWFERRLPVPVGVDPDKIEATYDKGILELTIPVPVEKAETARKIHIT